MNSEQLRSKSNRASTKGVGGNSYTVYFGMGHCFKLIDEPGVFKVSLAGLAFGSLLIRYLNKECTNARFLDLGTGSGVHSFLLKGMGVKSVTATDISKEAVFVARKNELFNFGVNTIEFASGDLFQGLSDGSKKYDVILFNAPGWRTPSASFLKALKRSVGVEGLPIDSMFYGDRTLERFFEELPSHLSDGGKVIVGLNSLVGIRQVMNRLQELHAEKYVIDCRLLERHDFPLLLYTKGWARVRNLFVDEVMSWTREGAAYCSMQEDGKIIWSYEIVEITLWKR
jgi:release factor glutamine methyltransferase